MNSKKALFVKYEQYELRFSHFLEVFHSYKSRPPLAIDPRVCHLNLLPRIDTRHSGSIRFFHFLTAASVCFVWLAIFDFFPLGLGFLLPACYLLHLILRHCAPVCVFFMCVHCAMITSQFPIFFCHMKIFSIPRVHFSYFEWHILFSTF
jgi:hypothetical protein